MLGLTLLLFFLPLLGPFIAGIVGGRKAGSFLNAVMAALLPAFTVTLILLSLTSVLASVPIVGAIATAGSVVLAFSGGGPLLLGAVIGGLFIPPGSRAPVSPAALVFILVVSAILLWRIYAQVTATASAINQISGAIGGTDRGSGDSAQSGDWRPIATALEAYAVDHGQYPSAMTAGDLRAALSPYSNALDLSHYTVRGSPAGYEILDSSGRVVSATGSQSSQRPSPDAHTASLGTIARTTSDAPASGTVLLSEEFDSGDSSGWDTWVSGWQVHDGVFSAANTSPNVRGEAAWRAGDSWADYDASVAFRIEGPYSPSSIEFRLLYRDESHFASCQVTQFQGMTLAACDGASGCGTSAHPSLALGSWYTLNARMSGKSLQCELAGVPGGLAQKSVDAPESGTVALRNAHVPASFDHLLVTRHQ